MKSKILPWIIAISALSVSVSAAFYSVSGLGKMFAGASLQVMILAGSLEFAKLVTASLLYEYWDRLNRALKYYLLCATFILILITSAGIYGFLSSAYQETSFKVENQGKNVEILDKRIEIIKKELSNYQNQVDQKSKRSVQITGIREKLQNTQDQLISQSRSTSAVRQQIKDIDSEIKRIDSEISVINDSISSKNSRISNIETQKLEKLSDTDLAKEVGPLKYIANLTGKSLDQVVNWYIIVLMLVFDPLAIALVLAANFAFTINKKTMENSNIKEDDKEIIKKEEELKEEKEEDKMEILFSGEKEEKDITISDFIKEENLRNSEEDSKQTEDSKEKEDKYIGEFGGYRSKNVNLINPVPQETINPLSLR